MAFLLTAEFTGAKAIEAFKKESPKTTMERNDCRERVIVCVICSRDDDEEVLTEMRLSV